MPKKKDKKVKKSKLAGRIKKVKELDLIVTALFYGRSGAGKTTMFGTFPGKKLVLDVGEKGTDSLSDQNDVDVFSVDEWDDFEDCYWELKSGKLKYESISVDAVHSLQELAILRVKEQNGKQPEEQTSKRDYGMAASLLKTWIINYRDLREIGIHVAFIAHERVTSEEAEDDEVLNPEVGPRMMPSVASTLNGAVSVIGHTFIREKITKPKRIGGKLVREVSYCMRLGPHGCYTTKIRSPKSREVPDYIVDPSYDKLIAIISGVKSKSKRKTKRKNKR